MTDLATLGIRIESQEVAQAETRLDGLEAGAASAEASISRLEAAARGLGNALLSPLQSIDASVRELVEMQRAQMGVASAASAMQREVIEAAAAATGLTGAVNQTSTAGMHFSARAVLLQKEMGGAAASARQWGAAMAATETQVVGLSGGVGLLQAQVSQQDAHIDAWRSSLAAMNATIVQHDAHIDSWRNSLNGLGAAIQQHDAHVSHYRDVMARIGPTIGQADSHMALWNASLGKTRGALQLTAQDGLNFSRQMADIGVTAAMGMSPLMIALQQGPQLFDILQTTAIRSGMTIRATMAAAGAVIWAALAPLLPIMAAIAAAAAVGFAAVGIATRGARQEIGDLTKGMGLTEDQMKRLKDEGISTGVTVGDVFRGTGTTIKEVFFDMFGDQIAVVGKKWDEFMDAATRIAMIAVKGIARGFLGTLYTIRDTWKMLPAALGDAAFSAANFVIRGVEAMINAGVRLLNGLIDKANVAVDAIPGMDAFIPRLEESRLTQIGNQYAGAMTALGVQAGQSFSRGMAEGSAGVDRAAARLLENIRASGQARIRAGAGDAGSSAAGGSGRSDVAKLREDLEKIARVTLRPIDIRIPSVDETVPLRIIADELRLIDQLARDAAKGMASAFGEAGQAMGDLLSIMTSYESRLAEIALAQKEGRLTEAQAIREQASAQIGSYGDMAAAAKGFFKEGSDGYQAMLAVEQVYRAFQFASAIQAMALGGQETAFTLGQNAIRAASHGVVAVARAIASLPFPLNLAAGAATIAALAAIGVKIAGGGGGSRGSSDDDGPDHSTNAIRSYSAMESQARDQAVSAIAQKVEVRVTADREGLNAFVVGTAQREATGIAAPLVAAAAAGTKRDVFQTLNDRQVGNRKVSV